MKNGQKLCLERVCFAFAFGISCDKDIDCLCNLFQIKYFDDVSNYDYFIEHVLPVFEMNYNKIKDKNNEKLKEVEKEIKVYLIKMCIQYVESIEMLKNNQKEFKKFQICLKILQKMTDNKVRYGERLLNKIKGINKGVKGGDKNNINNNEEEENGIIENYEYNNDF
jgi:esterase/lipase